MLGNGTQATITLDKTTLNSSAKDLSKVTSDELLTAINNQIAASSLSGKVTAGLDTGGRLTFQTTATGSAAQITVINAAVANSTSDLKSANAISDNLSTFNGGNVVFNIGGSNYTVTNTDVGATGTGDRAKFLAAVNTKIAASGVTASYDSGNKLVFSKTDGTASATSPPRRAVPAPTRIPARDHERAAFVAADIGFGTRPEPRAVGQGLGDAAYANAICPAIRSSSPATYTAST